MRKTFARKLKRDSACGTQRSWIKLRENRFGREMFREVSVAR